MKKQIELIKNQIADLKITIGICEHLIAFETLSAGSQELIVHRIQNCELQIQILTMELEKPTFEDMLFTICNPERSIQNV